MSLNRRALAACLAAALLAPAAAQAQTFPVKFIGGHKALFGAPAVGISSYQIAFITSQQGTASGGVTTKSRLTTTLANVPEETMRRLADEAYADLKAQFAAAGVTLLDEKAVQDALAKTTIERQPNNAEITRIGPTITIGKGVKKSYAAFGAAAAPALKGLHNPAAAGGIGAAMAIASINKLAPAARANNASFISPSLVIDFGQTEAAAGRDFLGRESASVSSQLGFGVSQTSNVAIYASMNNGRGGVPGGLSLAKDVTVKTPFATVATGEGAVRALSVATVVDSNYIKQDTARGDAVVVNLPVWEGLVRQAYKDYNAAIVAEYRKYQK
jgi:hypothetical protein